MLHWPIRHCGCCLYSSVTSALLCLPNCFGIADRMTLVWKQSLSDGVESVWREQSSTGQGQHLKYNGSRRASGRTLSCTCIEQQLQLKMENAIEGETTGLSADWQSMSAIRSTMSPGTQTNVSSHCKAMKAPKVTRAEDWLCAIVDNCMR